MELKLDVVLSSSIKRKKPWPRFCWLGQEKESVFLLDDKRVSEINMVSGRTKKRTPKLHPLLNNVLTMTSSQCGTWLCGVLVSGELFLWNRDRDLLKTAAAAPEVLQVITAAQGNSTRLSLQVSGDGMHVLLVAITGHVFLWECMDARDLSGVRDGTVNGCWAQMKPLEDTILPSPHDKEASLHTIFVKTEAIGDVCLSALVFMSGEKLIISCLKIQWEERNMRVGSVEYSVQWVTKTYPLTHLTTPCQPVKSRGALVAAFSPDGQLLAIVLNQRRPTATQVLYVSTQNFVSVSSGLGGCGIKTMEIPSRYIRSYWVGSVSWSPNSLFLACVLKRGSLLMLARLGGLLTLTSSGCNVDFGPAQFLPLHPLVTYWPPVSAGKGEASLSSSSLSMRDVLRQRYSVTWHPRLLYLIVSDGYMATVMKVLDKPSPSMMLKMLLKDTVKDLEKMSQMLDQSQAHVRAWLESVSCLTLDSSLEPLNPIVTCGPNTADFSAATDGSTLPLFLQDLGTLGGTTGLLEKVQSFLDDDSDLDGPPAGSHIEDGGRLEFASMVDTLHAQDTRTDTGLFTGQDLEDDFVEGERRMPLLRRELGKIQSRLLTAWAFSMSLGSAVEHRAHLLKHTVFYVVRFAALLHLIPSKTNTSVSTRLLHLIKALLSFLPWDNTHSDGTRCLGLVVELSKRLVHLLMTPHPTSYQSGHYQLSSQSLSTILHILQLVSNSLDNAYSLQQRTIWSSAEKESLSQPSDVHHVPMLRDEKEKKLTSLNNGQPIPQRPSSRLFGVWQSVYKVTQQYLEELNRYEGSDGWEEEQEQLSFIMSQMQMALQATGERLEEGPALLSYPGEHLYLCGLYPKSADAWRAQICEESNKMCDRRVFQEQRVGLALLYSLLSQYHLREAQELGDHMARLILHRSGHQKDNITDSFPYSWLPIDLHNETACAVVQSLGRFMASYFANQPLHILPPHNVAVLPPLHLPHAPDVGRLIPLCQEEVATAIRRQHLSEVWTVDYALDLLLLGGLLPEAVWLAYNLGDWKTAVSLSLAYTSYRTDRLEFARLTRRELLLPTAWKAENIFQAELKCLLGNKPDHKEHRDKDDDKSFTDLLEGEDWDLLLVSIQEILKASVMAGVNVMSSPLSSLLDTAKDLCSCLPMLVPNGLYLPSPPLYCPQPSPNTQDPIGTMGHFAEVAARHKVSGVLQRLLLLLRSARCCHPAAQWYITNLRRAKHILYKIKKKYPYPAAPKEEKALPEGLMKFVTRRGFFRHGPNKDGHLDPDTIQTIICFRELCGLCWMLHVRDQLSISSRKYQASRHLGRDEQLPDDSDVRSGCVKALGWARRFLPFSRFLNAEEILQDILLSLVSELPPIPLVADTLVQAFPEEEESVKVPLREKYNTLLQRLRQCNVPEGEKTEANESMMKLIQDKYRQRRKHLGRLRRHLAPPELHLWEKEEEEEERGSKHGMAVLRQLSLGTSLSTSTLTDCCFPPLCSDGDIAENTSKAVSPEQHCQFKTRAKKRHKVKDREYAVKIKSAIQEESHPEDTKGNDKSSLPVVGTWEFELEDEEYLNFLELFLSYELEKGSADGGDPGSELPLLKSFSSQLRKRELHSLTFDVLTTVHRRQRDRQHLGRKHWSSDPPVFRAGCCYKPIKPDTTPEPQTSSIWSEALISRASLSVSSFSGPRTGRQKGLFGLRKQNSVPLAQRLKGGPNASPIKSAFPIGQSPENLIFGSPTSMEAVIELQQVLDPKLEAQFPELGRLLEWMVRWADRRVLLGHHGKKMKERGGGVTGTADEGVVIRVKASAPAVLTSLSLLEWRYTALQGTGQSSDNIHVPETQWPVAPMLLPEVDMKVERESSIDTGYPGSTNTPITGLDQNLQGELSIGSCADEPKKVTRHRIPLPDDQDQLTSPNDLDVTPEKEGKSSGSGSEGVEASSSILHENISENTCTPDESLKLEDLAVSENADDLFTSDSLNLQAPPHSEPQVLPSVHPEALVHAVVPDSLGALLPNTPADPPSLQPHNPMAAAPSTLSTAPTQQPSTQSPNMRQQLGDDLFRLVQNINYVSMMEVLAASFSNLQLAQQNSLAQSNINSSQPHVPSSYVTSVFPQPNALPVQPSFSVAPQTQTSVPTSMTQCQRQITSNRASTSGGAGVNYQGMFPLSVHVESPEIQVTQSKTLIPSSQGLLATSDISQTISSAPVPLPSDSSLQNDTAPPVVGLKLQLQCHPLPNHSAPHYPPAQEPRMLHVANPATLESHQPELRHNPQATSKRAEEEKRIGPFVLRRQLSLNNPHDPAPTNSHSQGQELTLLPPATQAHTPALTQGLQLLHIQPVAQSDVMFPKLPTPFSSTPSPVFAAPVRETPLLKLSYIESGPKMFLPTAAPRTQMTRLITLDELKSSVTTRPNADEAQMQLLRVDPPPESTRAAASSPGFTSSKRQRRREERVDRERKTEVTFRPNESIIPPEKECLQSTDEPVNHENEEEPALAVAENIAPAHNFVFPLGSFDSVLSDQKLLDKPLPTSAELHAFAATCKKPPESQDAFTNTDSGCPPTLVDKSVSTSVTFSSPNSQTSHNEHLIQDTKEKRKEPETILERATHDLHGHQFLSVVDLEDKTLHQDLALCLSPKAPDVPSVHCSTTSAQIHVPATSAVRSSAAAPQPSIRITEKHVTIHPDILEDSQTPSHNESSTDPERVTFLEGSDPFDSEVCRAIKSLSHRTLRASSSPPSVWFSARMSEMDAQLAALQKIADYLENDFSNSRMLVNTIENLTPVLSPDAKSTKAVKKTVTLSVPHAAWMPQSVTLFEPNGREEEEESKDDRLVFHGDSHALEEKPSFYCSTPYGHRAGPCYLHSPPTKEMKNHLTDTSGISNAWEDETLGQTGLSDTAEILDELVKEGYLSPTDLDWSRVHQQQSSVASQKSVCPDEDRRELRIWMRRKQRERLAAYQKHRENLRERERKPFSAFGKMKSANRNEATVWRSRLEKKRFMLLEQHKQRTNEACALISSVPTTPPVLRTLSQPLPVWSTTQPTSTPLFGSTYSTSTIEKRSFKPQSEQTRSLLHGTAEVQGRPSDDPSRKLELHNPDRTSQVTRHGTLTDAKSRTNQPPASQTEERHVRVKTHFNKRPLGGASKGRGIQKVQARMEDGGEGMLLEPNSETSESNRALARLLNVHEDGARAGVSGMEWLDNLSESASSSLSKIDWAAIERMVAAVDD
ncbi:cilioproteinsis and planar polarity effector 1 isoform X1 [Solea senegalensis]|uniref:Cilioproteinsis and planar polarity effector 1 isoform X1 n=1 Tax=Solea senegalensis TaxID=28829 RepID=A0AAV6R068_SOLSE|nr:ciliogenesis and planar polarity effector 1 isoform X2 [Solea senegalensis]KAG7498681.1 cilioproteinsis and planar polarity effector 1 isoform X1 [Solea senegalensis]